MSATGQCRGYGSPEHELGLAWRDTVVWRSSKVQQCKLDVAVRLQAFLDDQLHKADLTFNEAIGLCVSGTDRYVFDSPLAAEVVIGREELGSIVLTNCPKHADHFLQYRNNCLR